MKRHHKWFGLFLQFFILSAFAACAASPTQVSVDASASAEAQAARWQAIAEYYQKQGMLNVDVNAAEAQAARWQAMADYYESMGMLTRTQNEAALGFQQ